MGNQMHAVEVCDLKHGRLVFQTGATGFLTDNAELQVTVTDGEGVTHEIPSTTLDTTLHLDTAATPRPIRSLTVTRPSTGEPVFEAKNLFPATDREFETQFKSHRDRTGDRYVDYFVANQIFDHFTGQEGYRISAAVAAAYKSIELMEESYLEEAERMLLESLSAIPTVKLARSTRNNREHLQISVLCALYHVHLARGNPDAFVRTLQLLKELLEGQEFNSYYNLAYNSALSLRLLILLQLISGETKNARATATLSFHVFKLAARDADENLAHFKELRYVHDNTYESMRLARRVKEVTEALVDKTLRGCLRVSADAHPTSYGKMRETFIDASGSLVHGR